MLLNHLSLTIPHQNCLFPTLICYFLNLYVYNAIFLIKLSNMPSFANYPKKKAPRSHTHKEAEENMPTEDRVCFTWEEYARHVREYWRGVAESDVMLSSSSSCLENFHDCEFVVHIELT